MGYTVNILGAGLAGSEAALILASHGITVRLIEMRPVVKTPVHATSDCAELVCSNSFKSLNPHSAAGMLKDELKSLGSFVFKVACENSVAAGGALAVDRKAFASEVTRLIEENPYISLERREAIDVYAEAANCDALIIATGPLTADSLAESIIDLTGSGALAFYDAAAPIVVADSLDRSVIFSQSRYEDGAGDYLNAPMDKEEYEAFIDALLDAERVVARDFEQKDLFQACQPIEEVARAGRDAPRFGALKPVGLTDPRTGRRPWAVVQLRAEDAYASSYNLVGFQTNLTFPEQRRVFRMIPGLADAEFARYGVMHRNTFIDAPHLLDPSLRLLGGKAKDVDTPIFFAGQVSGTEGYVEAIRSGMHAALSVAALAKGIDPVALPVDTAFGALIAYATDPETKDYQPSHVNFGLMPPLDTRIRNKKERYAAYAKRGADSMNTYIDELKKAGLYIDREG
ncbi:MAG: methylenetetrahydrofolate--tRNA-(uracil(54)-C(5))-methyltransferase (FADH(2)-oxidizing) TrmFO [Eggerthellaceae bacterium]|nr:methylenetetrahydrofolate--tRNA-(uracil(54)-C(5))-methyltransferase (FADH(2)-oxidizing) TrmFO [Eggerthellaceae bacterium]